MLNVLKRTLTPYRTSRLVSTLAALHLRPTTAPVYSSMLRIRPLFVNAPSRASTSLEQCPEPSLPEVTSKSPPSSKLYVGNINPLTHYRNIQDLFDGMEGYRKTQMTRHQSCPIAIIHFHSIACATRALWELQNSPPLVVQGYELKVSFAHRRREVPTSVRPTGVLDWNENLNPETTPGEICEPAFQPSSPSSAYPTYTTNLNSSSQSSSPSNPHPLSKPPRRIEKGLPFETSSNTLRIRSQEWWDMPPKALMHLVRQLEGFSAIRFRKNMISTTFVEFESNAYAQKAIRSLSDRREPELRSLIIDFASPPVVRKESAHLFIRGKGGTSASQIEERLSRYEGFLNIEFSFPRGSRTGIRAFVQFKSKDQATAAKDGLMNLKPSIFELITDIGSAAPPSQERKSNALYIGHISGSATKKDLEWELERFEGITKVILADTGNPRSHKGWAIVVFDTIASATVARNALPTMQAQREHPFTVRFYHNPSQREDIAMEVDTNEADRFNPVSVNVLSVRGVYDATQEEFHKAFETFPGFSQAVLFPGGPGQYMPYGKVTFHSAEQAQQAFDYVAQHGGLRIGNGENPVVLEGLRLRRALRSWKFRKPLREHWAGRIKYEDEPKSDIDEV